MRKIRERRERGEREWGGGVSVSWLHCSNHLYLFIFIYYPSSLLIVFDPFNEDDIADFLDLVGMDRAVGLEYPHGLREGLGVDEVPCPVVLDVV